MGVGVHVDDHFYRRACLGPGRFVQVGLGDGDEGIGSMRAPRAFPRKRLRPRRALSDLERATDRRFLAVT
jgi:hypothetical protein